MTERILFVCHANVCRSPVMMWTAGPVIEDAGVIVDSAGVLAARSATTCTTALEVLGSGAPDGAAARGAVQVDAEAVLGADLVLAATREERGALALLAPEARARIFTVREAALLGAERRAGEEDADDTVAGLAALLHARRGLLVLPPQRRFLGARAAHALDLPDVHRARLGAHRGGLENARHGALEVAQLVARHRRGLR